ncbi:MAG: ABC transporter ATP-binding protein [Actinomycetota bacterium]|nr:ABC transporter ATP-binding protein [Actinomycetota bacterium]
MSGHVAVALECRSVDVAYGHKPVLAALDLRVERDEILALLGPSGSGKSTLLYTVAGFVHPHGGEVVIDGRVVASPHVRVPPESRKVGLVFQHYALWPHLAAVETVAYPLRRRGVGVAEANRRAIELLERMGIGHLGERRPAELSGGEQQRVGLARALAAEASLYLFDEPTAHLDTALRTQLQHELAERRRMLGAAAVYATHDAGEALAVADRVALLRAGRVVQTGTPVEIYERPVDVWAALLTGPASLLRAALHRADDTSVVVTLSGRTARVAGGSAPDAGADPDLLVRPDWTTLGGDLEGVVTQLWYRGPHTDYRLDTPAGHVDVRRAGPPSAAVGQRVGWSLRRVWAVRRAEA